MDVITQADTLAREKAAFASGVDALALMEAAGAAMADRIRANYPQAAEFFLLVGKGNNGGDGLVVARHLLHAGYPVRTILTALEDQLGDTPVSRLDRLRIEHPLAVVEPWSDDVVFPASDGVVLDALLGIQARGPLRGLVKEVVAKTNAARAARFFRTVALDLPSGLAAVEEGPVPDETDAAIVADLTLAVGFAKEVLARETLAAWVGRLEVVPWDEQKNCDAPRQVILPHEVARFLPRRSIRSYKNDFGRLVIVAGSRGFTGAPVLCAQGAQGLGTGLLSIVTREEAYPIVAGHAPPEAMVSAWPPKGETPAVLAKATGIVIGPGLGDDETTAEMIRAVLAVGCPVLIDADGLNALAKNLDLLGGAKGPVLLTPHLGEMARLIGRKFGADEREQVARDFTDRHPGVTLVLKGTRTLVTQHGAPFYFNTIGNPGFSIGGSGDTLSGILGALLAQKLAPLDAARLGLWLSGRAADLALAGYGCEESITPTLLSHHLGGAIVSLRAEAAPPRGLLEISAEIHAATVLAE